MREFYLIKNSEGKYFRSKGYQGTGDQWVDIKKAKVYPTISGAKSVISWYINHTKIQDLSLVELEACSKKVITIDIKKVKLDKFKKELRRLEDLREYYSGAGSHYENMVVRYDEKISNLKKENEIF